ncbi:interleukin-11 isoform X1 [Macrotis lagotis]|uniref:interleukin-11 isoform X1 n=1 Tax=Macrotis lagotis TaxID=92651 RepID=UPI003D680113
MSFGAMGALQLPSVLTRLRTDLLCYLWHVHWLRRAGGPALRSLDPELGALQVRLDRLLKRLQVLVGPRELPRQSVPLVPRGRDRGPRNLAQVQRAPQSRPKAPEATGPETMPLPRPRDPHLRPETIGPRTASKDPRWLTLETLIPESTGSPLVPRIFSVPEKIPPGEHESRDAHLEPPNHGPVDLWTLTKGPKKVTSGSETLCWEGGNL